MAPRFWEWFLDLIVLPLQPEAVLELIFLVSFEDEWPYQESNKDEDLQEPEMHLPSVENNHELLRKPAVLHHAHHHAHRPCDVELKPSNDEKNSDKTSAAPLAVAPRSVPVPAVPGKTQKSLILLMIVALVLSPAVMFIKLWKGTFSVSMFASKAVKPVAHSPETSAPIVDAAASCCLPPGPIPNPTEQATPEELRKIRELEELLRSDKTYPPAW